VKIYGVPGSSAAYMLRDFLQRSDVPFDYLSLASDEAARELGLEGLKDPRLPVCLFADGTRMEKPTIRRITEKLGWFRDPQRTEYDVAIYGGGPAGLSAAVYAASEGLKTVLIERSALGGQAGTTSRIENYLGFPSGISGADLADRARQQAQRFGAEMLIAREGVRGEFTTGKGVGYLADGSKIVARATVCATGVDYRRLNLPDEDRLLGAGLFYGAGSSEASLCDGEHVLIVGGGNSAGQAAMHFSRYAQQVTMVLRGPCLRDSLSEYLVDRITHAPNVEVLTHTSVVALHGAYMLEGVTLRDEISQLEREVPTRWLFACIGGAPQTQWAEEVGIVRDPGGYLVTGPDLTREGEIPGWPLDRDPFYLETNVPGVFAAGDVRHGSVKRCASAVGEGAMAITFVHRYLANG